MDTPSRLLDPELLARLARTSIRVRGKADGTLTGIHRSPHHGSSVEFTEHKEYSPGDEIRHIDWKVYGRTDRHYVKRFEDETNLRAYFVLDCSGSMVYRGERAIASKFAYASMVVAHLGYLLLRQQDAVGLVAVADTVRSWLPPRARSAHGHDGNRLAGAGQLFGRNDRDPVNASSDLAWVDVHHRFGTALSPLAQPRLAHLPGAPLIEGYSVFQVAFE